MAPTISQVRASVVDAINAGGFGVVASSVYMGERDLGDLGSVVVEVVAGPVEADAEAVNSTELRRTVSVVVRKRVDSSSVAEVDEVFELAEAIGVALLNGEIPVAAQAIGLEVEPIDPDALVEGIAEAAANVVYLVPGVGA